MAHYTSHRGLQGIIASKSIWATEYRFLNDREEFLHAKELAQDLLNEEPEFVGRGFPNRENMSKAVAIAFDTGQLRDDRNRMMVASFTEEGDQLSQWRGYAEDSKGVSIGFDLRAMRPPSASTASIPPAPTRSSMRTSEPFEKPRPKSNSKNTRPGRKYLRT